MPQGWQCVSQPHAAALQSAFGPDVDERAGHSSCGQGRSIAPDPAPAIFQAAPRRASASRLGAFRTRENAQHRFPPSSEVAEPKTTSRPVESRVSPGPIDGDDSIDSRGEYRLPVPSDLRVLRVDLTTLSKSAQVPIDPVQAEDQTA